MLLRVFGSALIAFALVAFGVGSAGEKGKDDKKVEKKDKDDKKLEKKEKDKEKKPEPKVELKLIDGTVKSVDFAKASFTITADGKDRTFAVDESTKFVGPKGGSRGMGKAALKDETMAAGAKVRVALLSAEDKSALEVHLPARGTTTKVDTKQPEKKIEPKQPEKKVDTTKKPEAVPPPMAQTPPAVPQPEVVPLEPGPRVGPVRRVLRRLFRG